MRKRLPSPVRTSANGGGLGRGPLPVIVQPALVEEAVLRAISGHAEERAFRRERNRLYLIADWEGRERAFQAFHASWFDRLRLGQPIQDALGELSILAQHCARCLVNRAPTRHDEDADLLVASEAEAPERTVLVRVRSSAFDSADQLLALLRAELLHVADMLDPDFGYEPTLPPTDGGPSYERLLRDRYRALWDVSVAGRLLRRGVVGPEAQTQAHRAFAAAFPMLGLATDEAFARFFDGEARTHADLVAFAVAPRTHDTGVGLASGGRCPLCRFPTHAPEPAPERLSQEVIGRIVADFPAWQPANGLCSQCADLYRARPLSVSAAELLPGA